MNENETNEATEEQPATTWGKIWAVLKKWGLTGIMSTAIAGSGTWAFNTIDNLKDENIAINQQIIAVNQQIKDLQIQREAMWRRLYQFTDIQDRTQVDVQVTKQLFNILVNSKRFKETDLLPLNIKDTSHKSTKFEDFKSDALLEQNKIVK